MKNIFFLFLLCFCLISATNSSSLVLSSSNQSNFNLTEIKYSISFQNDNLLNYTNLLNNSIFNSETLLKVNNIHFSNNNTIYGDLYYSNGNSGSSLEKLSKYNLTNILIWYFNFHEWNTFSNSILNNNKSSDFSFDRIGGYFSFISEYNSKIVEIVKIDIFRDITTEIIWENTSLYNYYNLNIKNYNNHDLNDSISLKLLGSPRALNPYSYYYKISIQELISLAFESSLIGISIFIIIYEFRKNIIALITQIWKQIYVK